MKVIFLLLVLSVLIGIIPASFAQTANVNAIEEQNISSNEHEDITAKLDKIESTAIKREDFQDNVDNLQSKIDSAQEQIKEINNSQTKMDSKQKHIIKKINDLDTKNSNQYTLGIIFASVGLMIGVVLAYHFFRKSDTNIKKYVEEKDQKLKYYLSQQNIYLQDFILSQRHLQEGNVSFNAKNYDDA